MELYDKILTLKNKIEEKDELDKNDEEEIIKCLNKIEIKYNSDFVSYDYINLLLDNENGYYDKEERKKLIIEYLDFIYYIIKYSNHIYYPVDCFMYGFLNKKFPELKNIIKQRLESEECFMFSNITNKKIEEMVQYIDKYIDIGYDKEYNLYYQENYNNTGKRLYFNTTITNLKDATEMVKSYYMEQYLNDSPHKYINDRIFPNKGDVVIAGGESDGNFVLEIIDDISKVFIVEPDDRNNDALMATFKDYKDKIVIINKFLSCFDNDKYITIDEIAKTYNTEINYIKLDIEGAEVETLYGALNVLKTVENLKINVCTYHRLYDYEKIENLLKKYNFDCESTEGCVFFNYDGEFPFYPRKGLIQAIKRKDSIKDE